MATGLHTFVGHREKFVLKYSKVLFKKTNSFTSTSDRIQKDAAYQSIVRKNNNKTCSANLHLCSPYVQTLGMESILYSILSTYSSCRIVLTMKHSFSFL